MQLGDLNGVLGSSSSYGVLTSSKSSKLFTCFGLFFLFVLDELGNLGDPSELS